MPDSTVSIHVFSSFFEKFFIINSKHDSFSSYRSSNTRAQAANAIARTSRLAAELPPKALGHFPVTEMITEAQQEAQYAEAMIAQDPTAAVKKLERSRAMAESAWTSFGKQLPP